MSPRASLGTGERVHIRRLRSADRDGFLELVRASRSLHHRWSDPPETAEGFDELFRRGRRPSEERLLVCRNEDRQIVGSYAFSQIFYGPFRSAYLGYYAFAPFEGKGYMREGLPLVIDHAFEALDLHRIQANIQPANERSIALVRGAGFSKEGLARRYLFIDGDWRDHEQWTLLSEDRAQAT